MDILKTMTEQALPEGTGKIITHFDITLSLSDWSEKNRASLNSPALIDIANNTLERAREICQPKAVYRWLEVENSETEKVILCCGATGKHTTLALGCATRFLSAAQQVLAGVYSVGDELQLAGADASESGDFIESYFYDIIALEILEKIQIQINLVAEKRANQLGWGVGPLLSPGSVHGWELDDQVNLCSILPLSSIGVKVCSDSVLKPFKSLSFLVGIGPGYELSEVASTCDVCSRKSDCTMRQG